MPQMNDLLGQQQYASAARSKADVYINSMAPQQAWGATVSN